MDSSLKAELVNHLKEINNEIEAEILSDRYSDSWDRRQAIVEKKNRFKQFMSSRNLTNDDLLNFPLRELLSVTDSKASSSYYSFVKNEDANVWPIECKPEGENVDYHFKGLLALENTEPLRTFYIPYKAENEVLNYDSSNKNKFQVLWDILYMSIPYENIRGEDGKKAIKPFLKIMKEKFPEYSATISVFENDIRAAFLELMNLIFEADKETGYSGIKSITNRENLKEKIKQNAEEDIINWKLKHDPNFLRLRFMSQLLEYSKHEELKTIFEEAEKTISEMRKLENEISEASFPKIIGHLNKLSEIKESHVKLLLLEISYFNRLNEFELGPNVEILLEFLSTIQKYELGATLKEYIKSVQKMLMSFLKGFIRGV